MMMTGPTAVGPQAYGTAFMSITPAGGSTGVPAPTSITIRFGSPMAAAAEQYVDLHVGSLAGPTVAMGCVWAADRETLTCMPAAALAPATTYVVHLGGGMTTQSGAWVDFDSHGPMMGGQRVMGGMMAGSHAGQPWGNDGIGMARSEPRLQHGVRVYDGLNVAHGLRAGISSPGPTRWWPRRDRTRWPYDEDRRPRATSRTAGTARACSATEAATPRRSPRPRW
jgi:hypothetical protein